MQIIEISSAKKALRGSRGNAPYLLIWGGTLRPVGVDTFFVRPAKKGHGTSVLTREYVPKAGADFSIDNGVSKTETNVYCI